MPRDAEAGAPARRAGRRQLQALADEELIRRVTIDRDTRAFEVLYDRHAPRAWSLACHLCGACVADDAVQEAFLSLWSAAESYDPSRGAVRPFLLGIVRHRAVDAALRRAAVERRRVDGEAACETVAAPEHTDAEVARRTDAAQVRRAVRHLPRAQADVVSLAYYGGLTHVEIATVLQLPLGTVKGRMACALKRLAGELAPRLSC